MLEILRYHQRSDLHELLQNFDDSQWTWVVSDLKSKYEIQKSLLEKKNFFFEDSCLRISELWKTLLKINTPDLRIWPQFLVRLYIKKFLKQYKEQLRIDENSSETLLGYIQQLSPLFFHPSRNELIKDFFIKNPSALDRWQSWYTAALAVHLHLFEDKKIIQQSQIPSLLQNQLQLNLPSKKGLIFDLGTEVSQMEMDLIKLISKTRPVKILEPVFDLKNDFMFLRRPYERVQKFAEKNLDLSTKPIQNNQLFCQRMTSQVSEVKYVTQKIRELALLGIPFHKIGIMANRIEAYWPVLQIHLDEEFIPYNKDVLIRAQSLLVIQNWLNKLRILDHELNTENLETELFKNPDLKPISYEKFKKIYGVIYDAEDLEKEQRIAALFDSDLQRHQPLSLESFVVQSLKYWSSEDNSEIIMPILKKMMELTQWSENFLWGEWLSLLSDLLAQKEILLKPADERGVQVCNASSSQAYSCEHIFLLGLTDEQLKENKKTLITADDSWLLLKDYDLEIVASEETQSEFEMAWVIERRESHLTLLAPHSDFEGKLLTLSSLFLRQESLLHNSPPPFFPATKLDYKISEYASSPEKYRENFEERWWQGVAPILPLSVTALESYRKCAFLYAAERVCQLRDEDAIDIEVQALSQGSVLHKIFELILTQFPQLNPTAKQLAEVVSQALVSSVDFKYYEKFLLHNSQEKYQRLAERFVEAEKLVRAQFPNTRPLAFEKKFLFYYDPVERVFLDTQSAIAEKKSGLFRVAGSIDRIDLVDGNKIVLIDYKGSKGSVSSFQSWLKDESFQLLFYSWMAEEKLYKIENFEVISAVYLIYKDFTRDMGFTIDSYNNVAVPKVKKTGVISKEEKFEVLNKFKEIFEETAVQIHSAQFRPMPRDREDCNNCHWRRICRATHLN